MGYVTVDNFEDQILESPIPCVVVFKNEGCHLCRGLNKVIPRLKAKYDRRYRFAYVDTHQEEGLSEIFNVEGVPTIFMFVNGDGHEIPYPENPDAFSGYSETYLMNYLDALRNV